MSIKKVDKRIVGGTFVDNLENYQFMATIWYLDGEDFKFKCGASYIGKRYFLTAAHCLKNRDKIKMLVRMGNTNLNRLPVTMRVVNTFIHPLFDSVNLRHDIGIIEVDKDVGAMPIRIPCDHIKNLCYNIGHNVKVLGFGKDCETSSQQHLYDLKEVMLKVKNVSETRYSRSLITDNMFLAGDIVNGVNVDACTGDSGGPCIKSIGGNWVLVGVVSWGSGCGKERLPGVYTRVLSYDRWIRRVCGFGVCGNH